MAMQQKNNPMTTALDERVHTPMNADEVGHTRQSVLALHIGSQQDPGIRRKYQPNEDALFVMQGVMPSSSPSLAPTPFVLLVVADGMGGQGHGRIASRLAVQSLVEYMSDSPGIQQRSPES